MKAQGVCDCPSQSPQWSVSFPAMDSFRKDLRTLSPLLPISAQLKKFFSVASGNMKAPQEIST